MKRAISILLKPLATALVVVVAIISTLPINAEHFRQGDSGESTKIGTSGYVNTGLDIEVQALAQSYSATRNITTKSMLGLPCYSFSVTIHWDGIGTNASDAVVSNVWYELIADWGFGWGFNGFSINPTSGYGDYNSRYWLQVAADFDFLGFHDYIDFQFFLYGDGTYL